MPSKMIIKIQLSTLFILAT
uniref:Uncharacterized protein n=1 Tax=Romanomermis culicivorax TaxID=13658 RepID=A0A915J6Y0_ROMCU